MYFMIGVWGGEQRQYASIKFFLYTLFGSALMIVASWPLYLAKDPAPNTLQHDRARRARPPGVERTRRPGR